MHQKQSFVSINDSSTKLISILSGWHFHCFSPNRQQEDLWYRSERFNIPPGRLEETSAYIDLVSPLLLVSLATLSCLFSSVKADGIFREGILTCAIRPISCPDVTRNEKCPNCGTILSANESFIVHILSSCSQTRKNGTTKRLVDSS